MSNVFDLIKKFNTDRNLTNFDWGTESANILEEFHEFLKASVEDNENGQVDALADIIVFSVGALHKMGYNPESVMQETLKEILSRKGELNESTGKW